MELGEGVVGDEYGDFDTLLHLSRISFHIVIIC